MDSTRNEFNSLSVSYIHHTQKTYQQASHSQNPIYCEPCRAQFPTITAYEDHYESRHTHVCFACQKIFPGAEWLKLHLDEIHDTLLLLKKERGEKIVSSMNIIYAFILINSSMLVM